MIFLPRALSNIADARSALSRLSRSLHAEVLTDVPFKIDPTQDFALEAKNVSFEWESASKDERDSKAKSASTTKASGKSREEPDTDSQDDQPFQVQNIDLRIPRGTLTGVVGRVGSGKSSLLQGLIGEMRSIGGEFSFGGKVAYCPQTAWIQNASLVSRYLPKASTPNANSSRGIMCFLGSHLNRIGIGESWRRHVSCPISSFCRTGISLRYVRFSTTLRNIEHRITCEDWRKR
jgi:ABC-type uncharacterized transport system fused permease/ATPase subunit